IPVYDRTPESGKSCTCLFGGHFSGATAYIPSPRLRAEKAPLEQSKLLTCCNLTRRKRTRPCNDCPISSLDVILKSAQGGCLITLDHFEHSAPASLPKPATTASCAEQFRP